MDSEYPTSRCVCITPSHPPFAVHRLRPQSPREGVFRSSPPLRSIIYTNTTQFQRAYPQCRKPEMERPRARLRALQTRLTSELEHLTTSHTKLRAAQAKFRDCVRSITDGVTGNEKKGTDGRDEILVPLTSSLYVKGRLTDREKVLVDVGTGFYVEKTTAKAEEFYNAKVKDLETNLGELEKIVQTKSTQLRVVEESKLIPTCSFDGHVQGSWANSCLALRQKMLAGEGAPPQAATAG
ncbi:unnamed protein product [Penicillium olsonii]|uniref:Prefoldin subunit 5 n=1 Tax=Penicillium olsonii TaxID=99116 RepID=A0A9W4HRZ7_PENOL|nr:unnamed protein product [Penicillium olsonii]